MIAIDKVMRDGYKNRTVGATLMNAESSRSHSIFTVVIEMNEKDAEGKDHFTKGKVRLLHDRHWRRRVCVTVRCSCTIAHGALAYLCVAR